MSTAYLRVKVDFPPEFEKGDILEMDWGRVVRAGDWAVDPYDHCNIKHITENTTFKKRYWKIAGRMRSTI